MIAAEGIYKRFKLYRKPQDRLIESLLRRPRHHTHHALCGVSFLVEPGETLGIIGRNGAGKSTLLKILMGVLLPDAGKIRIDGKITGLLELGTGFDAELSGLENIERNGIILGMSRREIRRRRERIVDFAELSAYINEPLRTYSSGMAMRLAFSIAIHAEPRCFVVDEALSVGDAHFQQKCMRRIQDFRRDGGSLLFVSHDLNAIKVLCDRALLLDGGRVLVEGTPEEAVNHYNRLIADLTEQSDSAVDPVAAGCYGTMEAEIVDGRLIGQDSGGDIVSAGEITELRLTLMPRTDLDDVTFGMLIRDRFGRDIFGTNSHFLDRRIRLRAAEETVVSVVLPMNLAPGKYTITCALHSGPNHLERCYHWCDNLIRFEVAGVRGPSFYGVARLEPELRILAGSKAGR
jgi:lipopolysaccharide transport system ATP-binding protein